MSCDTGIHVNDAGTAFNATVVDENGDAMDISTASVKEYIFKKPNGSVEDKDAIFLTDGTDGRLQYTAEPGFLDQPGAWEYQGHIVLSGGEYHTSKIDFEVKANLD